MVQRSLHRKASILNMGTARVLSDVPPLHIRTCGQVKFTDPPCPNGTCNCLPYKYRDFISCSNRIELPPLRSTTTFSNMPVLRFPDIMAALDKFEMKCAANEREITRASNEWFARYVFVPFSHIASSVGSLYIDRRSFNLMPPKVFDQFIRADFPLLAAWCYPDGDDTRLRISADYTSILFT